MLPGLEMMACTDLAVPVEVMQHVVRVESSFNPYAIGVVGGRLIRQPKNLSEAVSTTQMLEREGYNFSLGLAQVNRYNLSSQGLDSYEKAFSVCPNLQAGARILAECYSRAGRDWGKAFSCYYSGNFTTGFRHAYVDKVMNSWRGTATVASQSIPVIRNDAPAPAIDRRQRREAASSLLLKRIEEAALSRVVENMPQDAPAASASRMASSSSISTQPHGALPTPVSTPSAPRRADDGMAPVVVRLMGQSSEPPAVPPAQPGLPGPAPAVAPVRDAALVF